MGAIEDLGMHFQVRTWLSLLEVAWGPSLDTASVLLLLGMFWSRMKVSLLSSN